MSVGWGIFGFGNLLRFAAMRFAAQMVLSGLGSLQFVMIPIVSNFLLGDKYTWEAFISIVLILGGQWSLQMRGIVVSVLEGSCIGCSAVCAMCSTCAVGQFASDQAIICFQLKYHPLALTISIAGPYSARCTHNPGSLLMLWAVHDVLNADNVHSVAYLVVMASRFAVQAASMTMCYILSSACCVLQREHTSLIRSFCEYSTVSKGCSLLFPCLHNRHVCSSIAPVVPLAQMT